MSVVAMCSGLSAVDARVAASQTNAANEKRAPAMNRIGCFRRGLAIAVETGAAIRLPDGNEVESMSWDPGYAEAAKAGRE